MTEELECPYCGYETEVPEECYEQDKLHEAQCDGCEKYFTFNVGFHPCYTEYKADCLNGGEHNMSPIIGLPKEYFKDKFRCGACGKEVHKERGK